MIWTDTMKTKTALKGLLVPLLAGSGLLLAASTLSAQELPEDDEPGRVRIQGQDVIEEDTLDLGPSGPLVDYREEMRSFIQNISRFARGYRSDFSVIVEDALALVIKTNITDEEQVMPARTFTRSVQGIMATGLYHGEPEYGKPAADEKILAAKLGLLQHAQSAGLPIFVLDKTDDPTQIEDGRSRSSSLGHVYGATTHSDFDVSVLPNYPRRPFNENPVSVLSLGAIKNFVVVGNANSYGREDEFALRMHQTNHDMIVVDVFLGDRPLSRQAVETLKYKRNGARRLVFARVSIGTAASYRYYWKANWREGFPAWLGRSLNDNPDAYYVEYWRPEWQRIITGDTASYIYGVVDQGYDGVVLADADIFQAYDGSAEDDQ
jgi:cysteinyl-tRNA synthetase, unknown class